MNRIIDFFAKLAPSSLYARFFLWQIGLIAAITAIIFGFFALNQSRSAMESIAEVWAPALKEALARPDAPTDGHGGLANEQTITVSKDVEIVYGRPPENAYAPLRTHLRWSALKDSLQDKGVNVAELRVSGTSGDSIVWIATDRTAPKWIGLRSNLEGTDFRWRWLSALALSVGLVAIAAWWLGRRIGGSLRELESAVAAFSEGKPFVAPQRRGSREIDTLVRAFERMARERAQLEEQRALMLASVSHDVRSPLARIRMAAALLPNDDTTQTIVERISKNVAVADGLIESFSDYVRAESERIDKEVDISVLVTVSAQAAGLSSEAVTVPPTCIVRGNEKLLQRAVGNLIDNAMKHGRAPVTVGVVANESMGDVRISVTDCGEGFVEADKARLMQPFERGAKDRGAPGSGLGLATVARIVQRHGGRFDIVSIQSGTEARIVLQIATRGSVGSGAIHEPEQ
jgi:two-component system, OmpR family, osmolarity sensor histidine kinase EnvZ